MVVYSCSTQLCGTRDAERGESCQRSRYGTEVWEEELRKYQCRCGAVQTEVVPLDGCADKARERYPADSIPLRDFVAYRARNHALRPMLSITSRKPG